MITTISSNLLSFIVGVVTGYLTRYVDIAAWYHKQFSYLNFDIFWGDNKEKFVIIMPSKDLDKQIPGTQYHDWLGCIDLINCFLKKKYTEFSIRTVETLGGEDQQQNLICVGGPIPNKITNDFLNREEIVYKFGETFEDSNSIIKRNDGKFKKITPDYRDGKLIRDYGIITRIANPHNENKNVIIACGCFGYGTEAALGLLKDEESLCVLNKMEGCYQILCTCEVNKTLDNISKYELLDIAKNENIRRESKIQLKCSHNHKPE